jgi:NAD(P)-dependent dehydrogenase (short-subunit alcohol dehydrogenase family)
MGDDWVTQADSGVPLGRILRPEDVACTVGFLLSDGSAMMTGSIINLHPEYPYGMLSLSSEDKR